MRTTLRKLKKIEKMAKNNEGEYHCIICEYGEDPVRIWNEYIKKNPIGPKDFVFTMNLGGNGDFPEINDLWTHLSYCQRGLCPSGCSGDVDIVCRKHWRS